jgi:glycosyltransferase involved in cell wall biosynthesis
MKIWLLTSETPLYNPGGIARYVDNFARYLAAAGHQIRVFGRDEKQQDREIVPGYHYHSVIPKWELCAQSADSPRPDEHPSWPYNVLDYWGAFSYQMAKAVLAEIEADGPPDIIESQEYCALPYYLLQRKLTESGPLCDVPVVVNAHSPDFIIREFNEEPRYQLPHYWTGRLEKFCLHAADAVICPSGYLSRQLEGLFGQSIQVTHFPLPWTDPGKVSAEDSPESGKALYFGRLEVRKGTLKLVDTCSRMWETGKDFTLHLVGSDTPYYPRACTVGEWIQRKHARWINEGRLVIRDSMPHGELMHEIRTAAVTLVPSLWENWPNTCIEAMSLGKVVIGSENGGQAEMIGDDGSCGYVFSWNEKDGFQTALESALGLSDDERMEMGERARKRIAGMCSPNVVLPKRLAHLEALARSAPRKTRFPFVNRHLRESTARSAWKNADEVAGLVSVVIPYYNLGSTIQPTIDSVLDADWPDKEIVLVDDGSDEQESQKVVEELQSRDIPGLTVVRQENRGLAAARNAGVEHARGQFILLLDADDQIEPSFIRKAMTVLERFENVHIVYSWERYMDASEDIYPCWNFEFPYLLGHNMTCPVSLLYRKSYRTFGPSKEAMKYNFEDFELWINLVKNGCGGVALVEPLSRYRVRENSMWQGSPREQHLYLQDRIVALHPELYAEYGAELFCLQNANGSAQKWIKPSANSPFDEYEQWSRKRITNLEKEAKRWWEHSVDVEKRLQASEEKGHAVWLEKNEIEKQLLDLRNRSNLNPS